MINQKDKMFVMGMKFMWSLFEMNKIVPKEIPESDEVYGGIKCLMDGITSDRKFRKKVIKILEEEDLL